MNDNILIGQKIRQRREDLGLTQKELSDKVGINYTTILRYEKGQINRLKLPVIQSIATALNVNPAWLIYDTDDKEIKDEHTDKIELKEQYYNLAKEMQEKNISQEDIEKIKAFCDMFL